MRYKEEYEKLKGLVPALDILRRFVDHVGTFTFADIESNGKVKELFEIYLDGKSALAGVEEGGETNGR